MATEDIKAKVRQLLLALAPENQVLFQKVIRAEQDKLHMSKPYGINDDLETVVREVIK